MKDSSRYLLTRVTNPSESTMPATSITPMKVRLMARQSNPRGVPKNPKTGCAAKRKPRRANPDMKVALTNAAYTTAAISAGVFLAKRVDQYMNDFFAEVGAEAQTLGIIKLLGTFGIVVGGEYLKDAAFVRNSPVLGQIIDPLIVGVATFSAGSALDLLAGTDILSGGGSDGALAFAQSNKSTPATATTEQANGTRMGAFPIRRRRFANGTLISSPTIGRQLQMGSTAMIPMHHGMQGSLEIYPTPQRSLQQMQGSIMAHGGDETDDFGSEYREMAGYYPDYNGMAGYHQTHNTMGASYETRCI